MKKFINTKYGLIVLIIFFVLLPLAIKNFSFLQPAEDSLNFIFKPIQSFFFTFSTRIKNFSQYFTDKKNLFQENADLKNKISDLNIEVQQLNNQLEQSDQLKEQLNYLATQDFENKQVKVIGYSSDYYQHILHVNKGQNIQIKAGYPVIFGNGILVGIIIDSNEYTSDVLLLNDNASEITAIIENEQQSMGIVSGSYGLSLNMELIPQEHELQIGQKVVTSGLDQYIPKNLLIGTVKEIKKIEGELFQNAIIEPSIYYDRIDILTVILPKNG